MKEALRTLLSDRKDPAVLYCKAHAPYDGCWWEPNYWLFKEREVFPIYVSGEAYRWFGFDKEPDAYSVSMRGTTVEAFIETMEKNSVESFSAYDSWELEEIDEIEPNPNNLNTMTAILANHGLDGPIWHCYYCERPHRGLARFLGSEGNGGVGIWLSMPTCDECFSKLRTCTRCYFTVMPEEDGACPSFGCRHLDDDEEPGELLELTDEDDEAARFGIDGRKFLADGDAGPASVVAQVQGVYHEDS